MPLVPCSVWAVGIYAGVIFLVPCLASVAVIVLGHKLFNEDRRCVLLAFGIQGGQLVWFVIGALIQHRVGASSSTWRGCLAV
jgi:hypothetical protein